MKHTPCHRSQPKVLLLAFVAILLGTLACGGLEFPIGDDPPRILEQPPPTIDLGSPISGVQPESFDLILVEGAADAPVIIQYSDWKCPHCITAAPKVLSTAQSLGAQLRFRNFPLSGACNPLVKSVALSERCDLARASICAHQQGKYEAFADVVKDVDGLMNRWSKEAEFRDWWLHPKSRNNSSSRRSRGLTRTSRHPYVLSAIEPTVVCHTKPELIQQAPQQP